MDDTSASAAFRCAGLLGGPKPSVKASTVTPARTAREATSAKPEVSAAKPKAGATGALPKPAAAPMIAPEKFARLRPTEPDEATVMADGIIAAGKKARTPTGTATPKPTGLAADIIAAGRKRRGEI